MSAAPPATGNPYVGPRAFERGETLYGREAETDALVALLVAERVVVLHSPSGAGKTSLIQAALIPCLRGEGFQVLPPARVLPHEQNGERAGANGVNRYVLGVVQSLAATTAEGAEALARDGLAAYLDQRAPRPDEVPLDAQQTLPAGPYSQVLIIDQLEEILIGDPTDTEAKQEFFTQLGAALHSRRRWALLALREEHLPALVSYARPVPTRLRVSFRLDLLGVGAAAEAIRKPAEAAGRPFANAAVTRLVEDLSLTRVQRPDGRFDMRPGPHVEPVQLQVVCRRLWTRLGDEVARIELSHLDSVGDVDKALGDYYAEEVQATAARVGVPERVIRDWFGQRLITEQGSRGQVPRGPDQSGGLDNAAIDDLIRAHLVRLEPRRGADWYELTHDRLIAPIQANNAAWLEQHLSPLQRGALFWNSQERSAAYLLRGDSLREALDWARHNDAELSDLDWEFLEASEAAEREREEARRRRILLLAAALVVLLLLTAVAFLSWRAQAQAAQSAALAAQAEARATVARAGRLALQAREQLDQQVDLGLLLSLQAKYMDDTVEVRGSLLPRADSPRPLAYLRGHTESVNSVVFDAQGPSLLAGGGKTIRLYDVTSGPGTSAKREAWPPVHEGEINQLALGPAGDLLASAGMDGIRVWNRAAGEVIWAPATGHRGWVSTAAFSASSDLLATGGEDGQVLLWSVSDIRRGDAEPTVLAELPPLGSADSPGLNNVLSVAFDASGRFLAVGSRDGLVRLYDVDERRPCGAPLDGHNNKTVYAVVFSPEAPFASLASASENNKVVLWDLIGRRSRGELGGCGSELPPPVSARPAGPPGRAAAQPEDRELTGHTNWVMALAFSPDGKLLASGGRDSTIILWDPATGQQIGRPLTGHKITVRSIAFSPDGKQLASSSEDTTVVLWELSGGRSTIELPKPVKSVTFSPGSDRLAVGLEDIKDNLALLDLTAPQPAPRWLAGHEDLVWSVAFSPDGRTLASGSADSRIGLWDVGAGRLRRPFLEGHDDGVTGVAFHPNGQMLASSSQDGTVRLWDLAGGGPGQILPPPEPRGAVYSVAFNPNGVLAWGHRNSAIGLWDVAAGGPPWLPPQKHTADVYSVAFGRAGGLVASGSGDRTVRLCDLTKRQPLDPPLGGHRDDVRSVAFSADGDRLASGSQDGSILLWSANRRVPLGPRLTGHKGKVWTVAFSPDGRTLASGSEDKTIILWDVSAVQDADFASWQQGVCRIATRNLDKDEWDQFVGEDIAYYRLCDYPAGQGEPSDAPLARPRGDATRQPMLESSAPELMK